MPNYEYECEACGHSFEILQSMTEPKLKKCPECGKSKLVRLIGSGSGIIFKGTGFYETDYKKKEAPKSENKSVKAKTTKPKSNDTESKSSAKTEVKSNSKQSDE